MTIPDLTLESRRRFYAEEIAALANLRTPALIEALAAVPRELFLPHGPWLIKTEVDFGAPARQTQDADPRHVYHNLAIAIDPSRQLFNGQPSFVATLIDALAPGPGRRMLHVGAGTGYYTALMAHAVHPGGRVVAKEVDEGLVKIARANLRDMPWVDVQHGDGTGPLEAFDGILVNAGVTHPLDAWLDALAPGGRLVLPLTSAGIPGMGATIGKGIVVLVSRDDDRFAARTVTFVAIYSAVGIRDAAMDTRIAEALRRNPFPHLTALRRDAHEPSPSCWLHGDGWCLSTT
ncbi:MAG: protein-L-isoaspartate O-methyltransferase family protein [Betaproteobacteria bacterium]